MAADERVTRSQFPSRLRPLSAPQPMARLPRRIWSDKDWQQIQRGYLPREMNEKWIVFAEEEVVLLHRSWTGHGLFAATFAPVDGGGRRIASAVVERDTERYEGTDDAYDCILLELVLAAIVLGEPAPELRSELVELTRRKAGSADAPADLILHSLLGVRNDAGPAPTEGGRARV